MRNPIKIPSILILILIYSSSCAQDKFDRILNGLRKNYVLSGRPDSKDIKMFRKDSLTYVAALESFYDSQSTIIDYLINNFEDCEGLSGMIVPFSLTLSSTLDPCELVDCKMGAMMLIDNYLLNSSKGRIICSEHFIGKESTEIFNLFKAFYMKNKTSGVDSLKIMYREKFITNIE